MFPAKCSQLSARATQIRSPLELLSVAPVDAAVVELAQRVLGTAHVRRSRRGAGGGGRRWSIEHGGRSVGNGGRGLVLVQVTLLAGATLHGLPDAKDAQLGQQEESSGHD